MHKKESGMKIVILKKGEDRRIRRGHTWVFSNEIASPLSQYEPGEEVAVLDYRKKPLGSGTINPNSLITCRLHSRSSNALLTRALIKNRIVDAHQRRLKYGYSKVMRLIHSEADGLPGLIVDLYDSAVVVQHNTVAMDLRRKEIQKIVEELFHPSVIINADHSSSRVLEKLPLNYEVIGDRTGDIHWFKLDELWQPLDLAEGQKTGFYLDQVNSRRLAASFANGRRILDLFSYSGGFGLYCAAKGADQVMLVDRSERALSLAKEAFERNKLKAPETLVYDLLKNEDLNTILPEHFEMVLSDPPPLIKSRAGKREGLRKYSAVFGQAFNRCSEGALAMVFGCSYHLGEQDFREQIAQSRGRIKRKIRQLATLDAGFDHPVLIGHPETEYLHGGLFEVW